MDAFGSNYQLLINGTEELETEILTNSKVFVDYSQKWMMFIKIYETIIEQTQGEC